MTEAATVVQQQMPVVTQIDPKKSHAIHLATAADKIAATLGDLVNSGKTPLKGTLPAAVKETPAATDGGENNSSQPGEATTSASTEQTSAEGNQSQVVEKPATPAAVVKDSAAQRLAKSLEIQKRAEAAKKKAQEDARRLEADRREAAELKKQAETDKKRIADIESEYQRQLTRLKTNPLEFAKDHGLTGPDLAKFVQEGADPRRLEMAALREDAAKAIKAVKDEAEQRYKALEDRLNSGAREAAEKAFYDYVDTAVKANPDAFAAMDVVYSKQELLSKANELGEKNERLQLGWDADKLLEEIENEAQADPRWQRIQSRFTKTAKVETPKVTAPKKNTVPEETQTEEVVVATQRQQTRDDSGKFTHETPYTRHSAHVNRVLRNNGIRF